MKVDPGMDEGIHGRALAVLLVTTMIERYVSFIYFIFIIIFVIYWVIIIFVIYSPILVS